MEAHIPLLHPEVEGHDESSTIVTAAVMEQEVAAAPGPKGLTSQSAMWEKFNALKKKREEVTKKSTELTKKSTEQRIKEIQQESLQNVQNTFKTELEKDVLRGCSVTTVKTGRKRKSDEHSDAGTSDCDTDSAATSKLLREGSDDSWGSIKPFLDVNAHLKGVDRGRYEPKTQLEVEIDEAIKNGELDQAELLSEQLANRDFGKKIADAIDAKRYIHKKAKEEEVLKPKRKKRLHWGFDHKERWEMKGNM